MNLVDRYIFKQLFNNSILILIFIVSIFTLAKSVQLIELLISRNLPASVFFNLIINSVPQIIPTLFTIIVSLSIFFVYSRMQTDKELIILRASSYSNFDLTKPTLLFGLILGLISFLQPIKPLSPIQILSYFYILLKMTIHQAYFKRAYLIQ